MVEPEKTTTYHQEVFDKLFGMIENISERVVHIETVNWTKIIENYENYEENHEKINDKWNQKWKINWQNEKW